MNEKDNANEAQDMREDAEKPSGDGWWYDPEIGDYCLGPFKTHEEFWQALNAPDPEPLEAEDEDVELREDTEYPKPHTISAEEMMKKYGITDEDIEAAGDVEIE